MTEISKFLERLVDKYESLPESTLATLIQGTNHRLVRQFEMASAINDPNSIVLKKLLESDSVLNQAYDNRKQVEAELIRKIGEQYLGGAIPIGRAIQCTYDGWCIVRRHENHLQDLEVNKKGKSGVLYDASVMNRLLRRMLVDSYEFGKHEPLEGLNTQLGSGEANSEVAEQYIKLVYPKTQEHIKLNDIPVIYGTIAYHQTLANVLSRG